jgi:nucleoside-diphosphate-sugar epimerase
VSGTLVIGAGGMIGRKLAARLPPQGLILHDVVPF